MISAWRSFTPTRRAAIKPIDNRLHRIAENDVGANLAKCCPKRGQRPEILEGIEAGLAIGTGMKETPISAERPHGRLMVFGADGYDVVAVVHHRLEKPEPEIHQRNGIAADDCNLTPIRRCWVWRGSSRLRHHEGHSLDFRKRLARSLAETTLEWPQSVLAVSGQELDSAPCAPISLASAWDRASP